MYALNICIIVLEDNKFTVDLVVFKKIFSEV